MHFHQHGQTHFPTEFGQFGELDIVEGGDDQQQGVGADGAGLDDLPGVDDEVFS